LLELRWPDFPLIDNAPPINRHVIASEAQLVRIGLERHPDLSQKIDLLTQAVSGLPILGSRKQKLPDDAAGRDVITP
jgi:hypothetical protein